MSMSVFEHLKNPYLAAQEVNRVLKPGGHFIGIVGFLESVHGLPHGSYFHHSYLGIYTLLTASEFKVLYLVPLRGNTTFEVPGAHSDDYERLYGQHDHVRWYGMDIAERMRSVGLSVEVLDMFQLFGREDCQQYALYRDDRYVFRFSK